VPTGGFAGVKPPADHGHVGGIGRIFASTSARSTPIRPDGTSRRTVEGESWLSGAVARCQKADPTFPRITAHAPHRGLVGDLGWS
jgi:hypothetical protein